MVGYPPMKRKRSYAQTAKRRRHGRPMIGERGEKEWRFSQSTCFHRGESMEKRSGKKTDRKRVLGPLPLIGSSCFRLPIESHAGQDE